MVPSTYQLTIHVLLSNFLEYAKFKFRLCNFNNIHLLLHRCGIVALWMASSALIKCKTRCNGDEEITNNCSGIFNSEILIKWLSVIVIRRFTYKCLNLIKTIFSKRKPQTVSRHRISNVSVCRMDSKHGKRKTVH